MSVFRFGVLCLLIPLISWLSLAKDKKSLFQPEQSCVAYQTKKTFFFVRTVTVTGKNCQISAQIIPEPDDKFHLELIVPVSGFDSGEAERDRDVAKLLRADVNKELKFISDSIKIDSWKEKIAAGAFELKGQLTIGLKPFPLTIEASRGSEGNMFSGIAKTKFKAFEIDPPKLFAGVGARVSKDLHLIFQLNTDEVLGAQTLLGD